MKPRLSNQRKQGLTLIEVLVVIAILAILAILFFPRKPHRVSRAPRIECVINLKQVGLAFGLWEGDNNHKYPMAVSVTNGGAMETIATGDVVNCFFVMSNELSTPRILLCPEDAGRTYATNFTTDFNNSHLSYFIGADVTNENFPQRILSGDDNLAVNSTAVKSGLVEFPTNMPVSWTGARHKFVGNIGLADGSVQEVGDSGLQTDIIQAGLATNRFAIP